MCETVLKLKNVSVVRGGKKVFSGLSLEVQVGRSVAILGPNGAGKSTILKLITRELYPLAEEKSSMSIFGEKAWDVRELRTHLGIVSNDLQEMFADNVKGLDIVLSGYFGTAGRLRGFRIGSQLRTHAREVLKLSGAENLAKREFATCSTGERRRLILARALVSSPQALILDEPTNGLDLRSSISYIELLRNLMRTGTTVVLVTHDISEIPPEIENVILLDEGKILASGKTSKVLTSKNLSRLFKTPLVVSRSKGFFSVVPGES